MLALLLAPLLALAPAPAGDRSVALAQAAREALAAGSAREALAKAEEALEWSPENAALFDLASRAAESGKELDRALTYAALALELAPPPAPENQKEAAAAADALLKRLTALDPLAGKDRALLGDYAAALLALGSDCAAKKFWINAVE